MSSAPFDLTDIVSICIVLLSTPRSRALLVRAPRSGTSVVIVVCTTEASSIYRPRPPRLSPLYQLIERYFPEFERTYDLRYQQRYGP